jgi:hypothetical protein
MSPVPGSRARQAERIVSIVKMQSLLSDSSSHAEYEELLDFMNDRRPVKIERIVSILRAQALLLGSGAFLEGKKAQRGAAEIPALVAYARSLLDGEGGTKRKLEVLPRNLGRTFAAKGWGLPLFGDYRPAKLPARGLLLLYSSPDGDGRTGALEVVRLGPELSLSYGGKELILDSGGYWLCLRAFSQADSQPRECDGRSGSRSEAFSFSRYEFELDLRPRKRRFRGRVANPYEYVYPYWFYDAPSAASSLSRFAEDVLCGIFRVPLRDAEKLAETFSGRLP